MAVGRDHLSCFKAYDIRGQVPEELDRDLAFGIGQAFTEFVGAKRVVVGHDIRLTSPDLAESVREGLVSSGADVLEIGSCGTEEVYFATFHLGLDGGIMVTASHNPGNHNGLKLVREGARPISADTGLKEIERKVLSGRYHLPAKRGTHEPLDVRDEYIRHLLGYVDVASLKPLKVVVNAGNGGAGAVVDLLEPYLPFRFVKIQHDPDGTFPNGVPNPLLHDNRKVTSDAVLSEKADVGIAWDGDFDRCFFFDGDGQFIEGYYIVGLLASQVLKRHSGARIVHDPRLTWNTLEVVENAGGVPVQSKSGHAFIKEVMRREDAAYGGEMSAHHFFREFSYCDSGMIPWLTVLEIMSRTGRSLSDLVGERMKRFPASGEINRRIDDPAAAMEKIRETYRDRAQRFDETDGIGFDFENWRFNLRKSNTEPLIRLNVESRGDERLMRDKTEEVLAILGG